MNPSYVKQVEPKDGFKSLEAFYPFYLGEHGNKINRRLHVLGTSITMVLTLLAIQQSKPTLALAGIIQAYAFAWFGHFVFEQNKPATFRYPIWSFLCDLRMWKETVTRQRAF